MTVIPYIDIRLIFSYYFIYVNTQLINQKLIKPPFLIQGLKLRFFSTKDQCYGRRWHDDEPITDHLP